MTTPAPQETPDSFNARRAVAQARLEACDHLGIKRYLALDSAAYRDHSAEGGLPANILELLGLVASTVLRCDDCINYHLEGAVKQGWSIKQIEDALNVAMVVGGTITIPHVRRGLLMLDQFAAEHAKR
jgi:AhpD family alkylhydroperoxidase